VPDGWSISSGVDSPFKHIAKNQGSGGCTFYDLNLANPQIVGAPGVSSVCAAVGTYSVPDVVARVHYEGDPPGKDDQHNDQFGLGSLHFAALYHQITQIGVGPTVGATTIVPAPGSAACGGFTCAFGTPVHDHGWGANFAWKFFVPMWPGTKLGSQRTSDSDNIAGNVLYCEGALELCGIGASNGNLYAGDAYWAGGFAREDTDSRIINTGTGTFINDKEKALAANIQYYTTLTDCTDPIHCLTLDLEANGSWVRPGTATQNTDWASGGLGKAHKVALSAEISWGTTRNGTTRPTSWRVDNEVQYFKFWQDLPCNSNGIPGLGGIAACTPTTLGGTQSALPATVAKDPWTWVWRETVTFDF
jgi:hypothetical protein